MTPPWPGTGRNARRSNPAGFLHRAPAVQGRTGGAAYAGKPADPRPAPQSPQGWEHWFLRVTKKAITADYLVHHDTPSAARSNRTHLVHATCHRTKHPSQLAGNTVLQQTT
jgi:hypothetical protein